MTSKQILTTFEAADMCQVSYNTIKNWIKRDLLPAYRTAGGHLRIKFDDFEKFAKDYNIQLYGNDSISKKKVVVFDNDDSVCKAFNETFINMNDRLEVLTTSDPFEAGYLLCTKTPDIFVINPNVEGVDSKKMINLIKDSTQYKGVKVAILKGETGTDLTDILGVDFSISKPFDKVKIMESISPIIKTKPGVRGKRQSK